MKSVRAAVFLTAMVTIAPVVNAATVTFSAMPDTVVLNPTATSVTGRVVEGWTRSAPKSRSPWMETGEDVGVKAGSAGSYYTTVFAKASAVYDLGKSIAASVVWGSPDLYNTVEFLSGGKVIDRYVLSSFTDINPGVLKGDSVFVTFTNIAGGIFDSMKMSSSSDSFEYANLSATPAPVPLPAGGVLLVSAIGGFAALRRRRRAA